MPAVVHPDSEGGREAGAVHGNILTLTLAFAAMWIITEWLRSWVFTGFAWNPLSAISPHLATMPAPYLGTYGLSGLWCLLAAAPLLFLQKRVKAGLGFVSVVLIGWLLFTAAALDQGFSASFADQKPNHQPPITIVQPNVGQQYKWEGALADVNFAKLAALTTAPAGTPPRLILWPEAAIPDYLEAGYPPVYYERSAGEARARLTALMNPGDVMLLGALKLETGAAGEVIGARNSVMTVNADGTLGPRFDKAHLVPFGEYLPLRAALSRIGLSRLAPGDIDFWPGPGPRTLNLGPFGKAGMQVCYEIIFSGQVADRSNRPDFIFNPSNDAWFGAWGPPQHLAQARLRAIEEGLPVIRATPTGISAVIAADGSVRESIPHGTAGRIDTALPHPQEPTLFARYGNILPLLFAAFLLICGVAIGRRRR